MTEAGSCSGTVLTYCNGNAVDVIDCAVEITNATCIEVSPAYGADCAVPQGDECTDGTDWIFCVGTSPGCLQTATGSACTSSVGPCDENVSVPVCESSSRLRVDCIAGQPWLVDCASYAGSSGGMGTCVTDHCEVPLGAPCDSNAWCAAPNTCVTGISGGTCTAPGGTDGGSTDASHADGG